MTDNDVVVTGLGATTPLGGDVASTWDAMLAGRSGVRQIPAEWPEKYDLPVRIAAPLAVEPTDVLPRVQARRLDRCEQVAVIASRQAWADAGSPEVDPERLAVVVGTGIGGAITLLDQDDLLEQKGLRKVSPLTIPMLMPNGPAAAVGLELGSQGGVHAPVSACASGAEALAWGWRMLKAGEVDVVVAGGAEAVIHSLPVAGFAQMRALSTRNDEPERASRPFDADRDGFVLGEGAGIMVLERADYAAARGARVYGRLAGVGTSADAYHITAPEPTGRGQSSAIQKALRSADLSPSDVDHVNAHATSTPVGDVAEAVSIKSSIGDHPVVTAPKSSMGHLLGAAGAVESIIALLSLYHGVIPHTQNLENLDPGVELDVVADAPRKGTFTVAVNDAFGFGGHNVALAFTGGSPGL
ncbi:MULTISPECIES: beta-ketoacyl-[acyl-carrier-protein] synthase family protein [Actinoalloteichus]|uniref:3-oxoacyl-(Acyl-carrier-protein) synthase n=1 Tax=Actinoalloteichus fjordicus TaxID=1612552 RepID=A0AAC9LIR5_9PSEU|nr:MULTISPECIES: beta-ketoacyl-[acyl-carrier-protein] synthase family protein [Actinoalloteichus]APU17095.1 3-oxoacyl-(acyl-carrier-protein) synthase [Actinoalloteichus fjordicus]APU23176.1 3-oxoacyl-(acyl-carrier-protein) synthase [Actinoalloteichus sp. GBA129-24]